MNFGVLYLLSGSTRESRKECEYDKSKSQRPLKKVDSPERPNKKEKKVSAWSESTTAKI